MARNAEQKRREIANAHRKRFRKQPPRIQHNQATPFSLQPREGEDLSPKSLVNPQEEPVRTFQYPPQQVVPPSPPPSNSSGSPDQTIGLYLETYVNQLNCAASNLRLDSEQLAEVLHELNQLVAPPATFTTPNERFGRLLRFLEDGTLFNITLQSFQAHYQKRYLVEQHPPLFDNSSKSAFDLTSLVARSQEDLTYAGGISLVEAVKREDLNSCDQLQLLPEKWTSTETHKSPQLLFKSSHNFAPKNTMFAPATASMATNKIEVFLSEVSNILRERNNVQTRGEVLQQNFLVIEPPYSNDHNVMIAEIRARYPSGSEDSLESQCSQLLPTAREGLDGVPWTAFIKFITQYFSFIRDFRDGNLLETYNLLTELVQKCNSALTHPSLGILLLPTVIYYSKVLARLAIGLDKEPQLIAHVSQQVTDDGGERMTLPERAANILRQAFVTCLNDRTRASGQGDTTPEGKKVGIYKIANLCLKILFQCKKSRNGEQIFANIHQHAPPLSIYPRAERVTYLYYLGRFQFSMNHFYRAQLALQRAYDECSADDQHRRQKRLILIYLVTSNVILGRFPSEELYQRSEASGLRERFQPICRAIAKGDLTSFRRLTDFKNQHAPWFIFFRIFLQLRNRCEVLVWRSLARKTFILHGEKGDAETRRAPSLDLADLVHLFQYLEKRAMNPKSQFDGGAGNRHTNWIFMSDAPPKEAIYIDPDLDGVEEDDYEEVQDPLLLPDMLEIESIVSSLIDQGLMYGYISHRLKRLAILGARQKPALEAGFPNVWEVIKSRNDDEVPGWKKEVNNRFGRAPGMMGSGGFGGGMVVNLSGARPVGAG